jgi:hypothetical protein
MLKDQLKLRVNVKIFFVINSLCLGVVLMIRKHFVDSMFFNEINNERK